MENPEQPDERMAEIRSEFREKIARTHERGAESRFRYIVRDRHNGEEIAACSVYRDTDGVRRPSLRGIALKAFRTSTFRSADLRGADLSGTLLACFDLSDADLKGAILTGARYDRFTRWPEGFQPLDQGAIMVSPVLSGANLEGQDLSGEDLTDADLRGANLTDADLRNAVLVRAKLNGANIAGADFTGADLTDAVLTAVRPDPRTRWPEGFDFQQPLKVRESAPTLDDLVALLKTLADPARLKILGFISGEEATVEEIADALELAEATVSHHLTRLKELSLVTVRPDGTRRLHLTDTAQLNRRLQNLPGEAIRLARGGVDPAVFEKKVIDVFFDGDRLREMPARSMKKQKIVLKKIVGAFETDQRYPEKQVNEILKRFNPDFATLRRYLVDYRFMARENNIYWRI